MMRTMLGLVVLGLCCQLPCHASGLPAEGRFTKAVTVTVKGEAISDLLGSLSKDCGVELKAAEEVADQKVTILVDKQPLNDVLNAIASLFDYRWKAKGAVYTLTDEDEQGVSRKQDQQKRRREALAQIDMHIRAMAAISSLDSDALEKLRHEILARRPVTPEDSARFRAAAELQKKPIGGVCARFYCTLSEEMREALRAGDAVIFSTRSPETKWRLPDKAAEEVCSQLGLDYAKISKDNRSSWEVSISLKPGGRGGSVWVSASASVRWDNYKQKAEADAVVARAGSDPAYPQSKWTPNSDAPFFTQELQFTVEELTAETGRGVKGVPKGAEAYSIGVTQSDLLKLIHDKLGLQIISDHYSVWDNMCGLTMTVGTVLSDSWHAPHQGYLTFHPAWKWDGKFVYMRIRDVDIADPEEVPNRLVKKWIASMEGKDWTGIDVLGDVELLSAQQRSRLDETAVGLNMAWLRPSDGRDWAYWLYGLLSPEQRKEILDKGTDVAKFTPQQRIALYALLPRPACESPYGVVFRGRYRFWFQRIDPLDGPQAVSVQIEDAVTIPAGKIDREPSVIKVKAPVFDGNGNPVTSRWGVKPRYTLRIRYADGSDYARILLAPTRIPIVVEPPSVRMPPAPK